ncbi:MAG: PorT family protein [Bacteroidaceae bacterium]|nr:PorT family protein [Bacteroidaceae bacterium]
MKQRLSLLIGFLIALATANAQPEVGTFFFVPRAGINVSTLKGTIPSGVSAHNETDGTSQVILYTNQYLPKIGFSFGGDLEYQLRHKWAISAGLMGNSQGARFSKESVRNPVIDSPYLKLDYIHIPLLMRYYINEWFALGIGLQPGHLIGRQIKTGISAEEGYTISSSDQKYSSFDLSVPFCATLYANECAFCEIRYNLGVFPLQWNDYDLGEFNQTKDPLYSNTIRNECISLTIGYKIKL